MSLQSNRLIPLLMLLAGLLGPAAARAGVHACVFEGGGSTDESLCGRKEYINTVHRAYAGQKLTAENILSGDGNNPAPDCNPKYFDPGLPTQCGAGQGSIQEVGASKYGLPEYFNSNLPESSPLTSRYQLLPASTQNFGKCLPPRTGTPPSEVCHIWSANHGLSGGAITAYGGGAIDPGSFSRAISPNSACATTRFITNNCHSGAMANSIFDPRGQVRPGVCGVSATSRSDVARGQTMQIGTVQTPKGEVVLTGITYNFTDEIANSLERQKRSGKTPTLDQAFADAYLNDPMDEIPISTSSFFLDLKTSRDGGSRTLEQSFENSCQLEKTLGTNPLSTQADALFSAVKTAAAKSGVAGVDTLDPAEQEKTRKELALQKQRLLDFEKALCSRHYAGECTPQNAAGFIQGKFQAAYRDPMSRNYQAIKDARREFASEDARLTELMSARSSSLTAAEKSVRDLGGELERLERKYSQNYVGGVDGRIDFKKRELDAAQAALSEAKGKEARAAVQQKVDQARTAYEEAQAAKVEYQAVRSETVQRLTAAKDSVKALQNPGPEELEKRTKTRQLSDKIRELEQAMGVDKNALAPKGGFRPIQNDCGSDGGSPDSERIMRDFRRYQRLRQIHEETLKLFTQGTPEHIKEYMTVRDCETSSFMAQAPGVGASAAESGSAR